MSSSVSEENRVENHTDAERAMAPADRQTLEAIFHHPVPHNLHWMDALRLLTHLGTAEENSDGKYSVRINGNHLVFHKPQSKQLDAREVTELRHYLSSVGISPKFPYGPKPTAAPTSVDVIVLIDHHGVKLYRVQPSSHPQAETIKPYDPHHFLHHLHHREELREQGQRPAEDLAFYDKIADALGEADRIVLLSHGTGVSNAAQFLVERLEKHHPRIYSKVVRQVEADTSAITKRQVLELGRQALAVTA
jgi:hypothetical protein